MAGKKKVCYSGIGGQAVLEGVMMKNKDRYAVAVRKPNGEIDVEISNYQGILEDSKLKKLPFIRGVFNFIDSLILGMKALNHSADFYEEEEEETYEYTKYTDDSGSIVYFEFDNGTAFILNYNYYAVDVAFNGVTYRVAAYGGVRLDVGAEPWYFNTTK